MQGSRGRTNSGWKWALTIGAGLAVTGWINVTPAHAVDNKFIEMNALSEQQLNARVAEVLADPTKFTEGDLIVKYKPGTDAAEIAGKHAATVSKTHSGLRLSKLKVNQADLKQTFLNLVRDPEVEYVQPNYKYSISEVSNDPSYGLQWSLPKMRVPEAWGYTKGDPSMVIAVVDTGVRMNHPDLAANLLPGYNAITNDSNVTDDHGHGTHVSGIAAGITDNGVGISGVAGKVKILPIKAMGASGSGSDLDIAEGITWAADHGAKVINLSLGSAYYSQTQQDAINYAWSKGCLIIAASGNDNTTAPHYPAAGDHVISVMATDANNARASFSNYGTTVDLAAPGTAIYSTTYDGGYNYMQGTSMASPNVAGVAALVWSYRPTLTNAQLEKVLESSTVDLGTAGKDSVFGYGLVNAYSAMTTVVDTTPIGLTVTGVTPNPFNPTGSNTSTLSYSIAEPGNVTLKILDSNNNLVKTILNNTAVTAGTKTATWDGKNASGQIVAEGAYSYVLSATDSWGNASTPLTGKITVDRTAPALSAVSVTPGVFAPSGTNSADIAYTLSENAKVTVGIYNSSNTLVKAIITNVAQNAGANTVKWDGKNAAGEIVRDGNYSYKITVTDYVNLSAAAASGAIAVDRLKPTITAVTDTPDPFKVTGLTNSTISYTLSEDATVSVKVYNSAGTLVRTLQNGLLPYGVKTVAWNGKNDAGALVDDGTYTYKINAADLNNNAAPEVTGTITTDKTAPTVTGLAVTGTSAPYSIGYTLSENAKVLTVITNSAGTVVRTLENNVAKSAGANTVAWDGKNLSNVLLPDGTYTVKVTVVDGVGFTSTPVSATVKMETGAAKITAVTDTPDPFKVTGTTNTTISYTLSEDATVSLKIYDAGGTLVRTLVNGANTLGAKTVQWNAKNEAGALVADGVYTYKLNATDGGGNATPEVTGTITTDKSAPVITPAAASVKFAPGTGTASLGYTLSENAKVTSAIYNSAGSLVKTFDSNIAKTAGNNPLTWDGKNTAGVVVPDGTYTLKISATDAVGWVSTPVSVTITVESGAVKITAVTDTPDPFKVTGTTNSTIAYTLSEDATVSLKIYDAGGTLVRTLVNGANTLGAKTVQWNAKNEAGALVADGVYTYKLNATDGGGNAATEVTGTITTDKSAPVVTPAAASVKFAPGTGTASLGYTLSENAKVTSAIYNSAGALVKTFDSSIAKSAGTIPLTWDGKNTAGVVVPDGTYTLKISATDAVGWVSTPVSVTITAETGAAKVTAVKATPELLKVAGTAYSTITYTLSEDATVSLKLYDASGTLVRTLVNGANTFGVKSVQWNAKNDAGAVVADGVYTYKLNATDGGGNVTTEVTGTITTDKTAPTITPAAATVTFAKGTESLTAGYTLSENAKVSTAVYTSAGALVKTLETNVAKNAGSNTLTWDGKNSAPVYMPDGAYTVKITATDAAGWSSTVTTIGVTAESGAAKFTAVSDSADPFKVTGTSTATIAYTISEDANVTLKLYDANGTLVRTLFNGPTTIGAKTVIWNGKNDAGALVEDGVYTYKLNATDSGGNVSTEAVGTITTDKNGPVISGLTLPSTFYPSSERPVAISYQVSENAKVVTTIEDANGKLLKTLESNLAKTANVLNTVQWSGQLATAPYSIGPGTYRVKVQATDALGWVSTTTAPFTVESPPIIKFNGNWFNPLHYTFTTDNGKTSTVSYNLSKDAIAVIEVVDKDGYPQRKLLNSAQSAGYHTIEWDGRTEAGVVVPDGSYTYRMRFTDQYGGTSYSEWRVVKDTIQPVVKVSTQSATWHPTGSNEFQISYMSSEPLQDCFIVLVNEQNQSVYEINMLDPTVTSLFWNGRDTNNVLLTPGTYKILVTGYDYVCNEGATETTLVIN